MKTFLVKQKFRLGGERFDIKDDRGVVNYQVEGSFFQIPKTFTIYDAYGEQVSEISKEFFTLLPRFNIQLRNGSNFVIRKKLTFWRDKYEFDNLGLRIEGNYVTANPSNAPATNPITAFQTRISFKPKIPMKTDITIDTAETITASFPAINTALFPMISFNTIPIDSILISPPVVLSCC